MSKFNDLLNLRFKARDTSAQAKMTALVERSSNGDLSSFSGVFRVTALNDREKEDLAQILRDFRHSDFYDIDADLKHLSSITSEVKAITNQAVILHGERVKKAQDLLKKYKDGAFTAWLFATYGNRQTPYNFLQYYEFYTSMPPALHTKIDQMPRQVIYSLASRAGSIEQKEDIVKSYNGQTKQELLQLIRVQFPLPEDDGRQPNLTSHAISYLKRAREVLKNPYCEPSNEDRSALRSLIAQLQSLVRDE
ncbi:MAG: hypothetical protein RL235_132 [Chlamydiota bacterium]|jgi:hypothetical protein